MAEIGRPSSKSPETIEAICEGLINGKSLRNVCQQDDMPSLSTVMRWLRDDEEFQQQYARAKQIGMELLGDELLDIADDGSNDWIESNDPDNPGYKFNGEAAQRSRLRVDTRKWVMSKLAPKQYGDKVEHEHGGTVIVESVNYADRSDTT